MTDRTPLGDERNQSAPCYECRRPTWNLKLCDACQTSGKGGNAHDAPVRERRGGVGGEEPAMTHDPQPEDTVPCPKEGCGGWREQSEHPQIMLVICPDAPPNRAFVLTPANLHGGSNPCPLMSVKGGNQ